MSNASVKIAIALFMVLTPPAASFARGGGGGHGGGHGGFAAMRAFSRPAGAAGTGNLPISGIPRGPGNAGGLNNSRVDPSGVGIAARMATPQPLIEAPTPPAGSRIPAEPPPMIGERQALGEESGGHSQPRANQVRSERSMMSPLNPKDPVNQENLALDRMLDICRGC
jgi:hypothetical protein